MTILHLIRSYGNQIPGGAEINIENLVNSIYKTKKTMSIVLSDNGVWIFNKNSKKIRKSKKKYFKENIYLKINFKEI